MYDNDLFDGSEDDYSDIDCNFCEYPANSLVCFYEKDTSKTAKSAYKISAGIIVCASAPFLAINDPQIHLVLNPLDNLDTRLIIPHAHIVQSLQYDAGLRKLFGL